MPDDFDPTVVERAHCIICLVPGSQEGFSVERAPDGSVADKYRLALKRVIWQTMEDQRVAALLGQG